MNPLRFIRPVSLASGLALGAAVFGSTGVAEAASGISNPEGHWQLSAPTAVAVSATYTGSGEGRSGSLALADFPPEAGNIAGQVAATVDIEYQAGLRQITFYLRADTSFPAVLDRHDRGFAADVFSDTEAVPGFACTRRTSFSFDFEFASDVSMEFAVLQRIEFISTSPSVNCSDYLASVRVQLDAGAAPQPWPAFAASGGIKLNRLDDLSQIQLTYAFAGTRLSPTTTLPPHCTDAPSFDRSPVDLAQVNGIIPLGNFNPPAHTFPTSHMYFYFKRDNPSDPRDWSYPTVSTPVRAMGAIRVTEVATLEELTAVPPYTDYTIRYVACRELSGYFQHMTSLDPVLAAMAGPIGTSGCETYSTGGATFRSCGKNVSIDVAPGFVLGTAGGNMRANGLDVGTVDQRVTLGFLSPEKRVNDVHTVCIASYMDAIARSAVEALLGDHLGDYHRTTEPVCGGIMYDVAGTASGHWYFPGASTGQDDPHMALAPNNINPAFLTFSVGTSVASLPTGTYSFAPAADPASLVNRPFAAVVPGSVYCYEALGRLVGAGLELPVVPRLIFLDMPDAAHVRIASTAGSSNCGPGPFVMPPGAATFER